MTDGDDLVRREWVEAAYDDWLRGAEGVLVVKGPPGTGKTVLAQELARARPEIVHLHVCRANDDATLDPGRFVDGLAEALARALAGYAAELAAAASGRPVHVQGTAAAVTVAGGVVAGVHMPIQVDRTSARPAFDRLVRRPLERLAPDGHALVVVVDGLDESLTYSASETLVALLESVVSPAPPRPLRFVVTTRRDRRVLDRLRASRVVDLLEDAPDEVDDVGRYARRRLAAVPADRLAGLASELSQASEGNFLYARYVLDDLLARGVAADLDDVQLPQGLHEHYHAFLQRELTRSDEAWEERYRPLLGLLAAARGGGLTRRTLVGALGVESSKVDDALRRLGQYVEAPARDGPFRIYHQSFRDFLVSDLDYGVYPDEAAARLRHLLDRLQADAAALDLSPGRRDDRVVERAGEILRDSWDASLELDHASPSLLRVAWWAAKAERERGRLEEAGWLLRKAILEHPDLGSGGLWGLMVAWDEDPPVPPGERVERFAPVVDRAGSEVVGPLELMNELGSVYAEQGLPWLALGYYEHGPSLVNGGGREVGAAHRLAMRLNYGVVCARTARAGYDFRDYGAEAREAFESVLRAEDAGGLQGLALLGLAALERDAGDHRAAERLVADAQRYPGPA